jgi:purine-binding chemotaxis protein CheW
MLGKNLLFALGDPRFALPLSIVEKVVRAVEITPLPRAPRIVLGLINEHGRTIPVVDIRALFRLPARETGLGDRFIILRTPRRVLALAVDRVIGISDSSDGRVESAGPALSFAEHLRGIAQLDDGIVLIYDLDGLLSLDEEALLDAALSGGET